MDVMLVDDDVRLRQILARLLKNAGIQNIYQAGNGEEALEALQYIHPDLILTDYDMPLMDGVLFVRNLRDRGDSTPVIMVSGHSDPHDIGLAARAGVDSFVLKPINPDLLFEKMEQALVSRRILT